MLYVQLYILLYVRVLLNHSLAPRLFISKHVKQPPTLISIKSLKSKYVLVSNIKNVSKNWYENNTGGCLAVPSVVLKRQVSHKLLKVKENKYIYI